MFRMIGFPILTDNADNINPISICKHSFGSMFYEIFIFLDGYADKFQL